MVGSLGTVGGCAGDVVALAPVFVGSAATGAVSQLTSNLTGTVTFSKVSGSGNIAISSAGAVSATAALGAAGTNSFVARAANGSGDAVEKAFTLTGVAPLNALSVSATSFAYGAAAGTVIGTISGKTAGSALSISPNDGRVALSGSDGAGWSVVVGGSAWTAGATVAYTVSETLTGAANSPRANAASITATRTGSYVFTSVPKLAVLGDSLMAHQHVGANDSTTPAVVTKVKINPLGELSNLVFQKPRILMEQWPYDTASEDGSNPIKWTTGADRALSGSTIPVHVARTPGVAASNADIVMYGPTINSVNDASAESTIINSILEPLYSAGKFIVVTTMRPIEAGGLNDGASYVANRSRINAAMATWAASKPATRVLFINLDTVYDPDGDGYMVAGWTYDKTHLNPLGADKGAVYINACLDPLFDPSVSLWASQTALTNYQPNWNLTGTTGTKGFTVTGTVPAGWDARTASGITTSAVASVEANAATGGQSLVLTVTPSSSDGNSMLKLQVASTGSTGATTVAGLGGKYLRALVEIELDGNPGWGVPCLYFSDNSGTGVYRRVDFDNIGNSACLPNNGAAARSYYLMTDPLPLISSSTGYRLLMLLPINTLVATGAPVAKIKRVHVVECGDPVPRWNIS